MALFGLCLKLSFVFGINIVGLGLINAQKITVQKNECNSRSQQKVDTNLGRIMSIGTYRKLPENIGHMRRFCQ